MPDRIGLRRLMDLSKLAHDAYGRICTHDRNGAASGDLVALASITFRPDSAPSWADPV